MTAGELTYWLGEQFMTLGSMGLCWELCRHQHPRLYDGVMSFRNRTMVPWDRFLKRKRVTR